MVEGDVKAPFSIATTVRCKGGRYSFPWIALRTLDPYFITLCVKQGDIEYHFCFSGMTQLGIEPRFPEPLANSLTVMYIIHPNTYCHVFYIYIYIYIYMNGFI